MPPGSTSIEEEGVLLDNVQLVDQGRFLEEELLERFMLAPIRCGMPPRTYCGFAGADCR
jgi:N-methylhydantoinase B/oxoprolinase/acetone carboxylase alpha subunit